MARTDASGLIGYRKDVMTLDNDLALRTWNGVSSGKRHLVQRASISFPAHGGTYQATPSLSCFDQSGHTCIRSQSQQKCQRGGKKGKCWRCGFGRRLKDHGWKLGNRSFDRGRQQTVLGRHSDDDAPNARKNDTGHDDSRRGTLMPS